MVIDKKGVKKILVFSILGLFMISMMAGVLGATGEEVGENIAGFFVGLFTGLDNLAFGESEIFSKIFFALLLAMLIYSVLGTFLEGSPFIRFGVSVIVTILAIFSIPANFLEAIRTQYGVMGAALLTIIPFAIVTLFTIKVKNKLIGSVTWVFYTMYYFAIFIGKLVENWNTGAHPGSAPLGFWNVLFLPDVFPYVLAVVAGVVMVFFLGYFREWFFGATLDSEIELAKAKNRARAAGLNAEAERLEATGISQS